MIRMLCALLLVLVTLLPIAASRAEAVPAQFLDNDPPARHIKVPDDPNNVSVAVPCEALVLNNGELRAVVCFYSDDRTIPYAKAVTAAVDEFRLQPAVDDGMPARVVVHFSVRFLRTETGTDISVVLNHGRQTSLYGDDYLEPQWIIEKQRTVRTRCTSVVPVAWITVLVLANGTSVQPQPRGGMNPECKTDLATWNSRWRFIPAMKDGMPVDAYFSNPFYGRKPSRILHIDTMP